MKLALLKLAIGLFILSTSTLYAQEAESIPGIIVVCPAGDFDGHHHVHIPREIEDKMNGTSLRGDGCAEISVTYNDFTPEAQAAFAFAVDIWENALSSDVVIEIEANWTVLSEGVLGSAGPAGFFNNFANAPDGNFYPSALANKIAGFDLDSGEPDITTNFNSTFDWYYGTDGNAGPGQFDLVSVVLHELGHGLGFISSRSYDEDNNTGSFFDPPIVYDPFLELGSAGNTTLISISSPIALGNAFTSNNVYSGSDAAIAANGGAKPQVYAPNEFAGGSSLSHWDEDAFPAGNSQSLMTPQIGPQEIIHDPGTITLGLFEDMGWSLCETVNPTCETEALIAIGETSICPGDEATVNLVNPATVPVGGGFGINFYSPSLDFGFNLTNVMLPYTFDDDLNGVLSANDIDPLLGIWELTSIVYTDPNNASASICATGANSVDFNFLEDGDPLCQPNACGTGDLIATSDTNICPDNSGTVDLAVPASIPSGGGFGINFYNPADDSGFNLTGVPIPYTFDNDLNGVLSANDIDLLEGIWELTAIVYTNPANASASICSTAENSVEFNFLLANDPLCNSQDEPCETWVEPTPTTGWINFNEEFGGAPCDDGSGCPFNEIQGFEVWASEAYTVENFIEGGVYTFSMCNGPGAGSWTPDFTIIAPSGNVDAFGTGDGDGCSITWTASESGTYFIVINELGNCGVDNTTNNGFPALTCVDGTADCSGPSCSTEPLVTIGSTEICPDETGTVDLQVPAEIPSGGGFGITFQSVSTSESFELIGIDLPYEFDNDLNGVLSSNGADLLEGSWFLTAIVYTDPDDVAGSICATAAESVQYTFLDSESQECDPFGAPCLTWAEPTSTTGWTNFNDEFGGAPCDDGSGCPFNEITGFQVWASEAYTIDNFIEGGVYVFSMCNGAGAGSWIPNFTIIAPSGSVDNFGAGDGDGCSITWTASESGTYLIVINEAGNCGLANEINNGFPAITCVDGTANCEITCDAGEASLPDGDEICPDESLIVENTGTTDIPSNGGYRLKLIQGSNTYFMEESNSGLSFTIDNTLNGVVTDAGDSPLLGTAEVSFEVYSNTADPDETVCAESNTVVVDFLDASDPLCTLSAGNILSQTDWNIYPNPATEFVIFNAETEVKIKDLTFYDVSGREVKRIQINNQVGSQQLEIPTNEFAAGVYTIILRSEEGQEGKKLLINK